MTVQISYNRHQFCQKWYNYSQNLYHFYEKWNNSRQNLYHFSKKLYHFSKKLYHFSKKLNHFSKKLYHFFKNLYHFLENLYHFSKTCTAFLKSCTTFPKTCTTFPKTCTTFLKGCTTFPKSCTTFPKTRTTLWKTCTTFPKSCSTFDKTATSYIIFVPSPLGNGCPLVTWNFSHSMVNGKEVRCMSPTGHGTREHLSGVCADMSTAPVYMQALLPAFCFRAPGWRLLLWCCPMVKLLTCEAVSSMPCAWVLGARPMSCNAQVSAGCRSLVWDWSRVSPDCWRAWWKMYNNNKIIIIIVYLIKYMGTCSGEAV